MDKLYVDYQSVNIMEKEQQELAWLGKEIWKKQNPEIVAAFSDEIRELEASFAQELTKEAAGERESVIYWDRISNVVDMTDPVYGDYTSVMGPRLAEIRRQKRIPLIKKHTHPNDALPSPNDYYPIIRGDLRAILVLCPNLQILALSTSLTPILSSTHADALTDYWRRKTKGEGDDEGPCLIGKVIDVDRVYGEKMDEKWQELASLTAKVQEPKRLLRKERRQLERDILASRRRFDGYNARYKEELKSANSAFSAFVNATALEYARLLNVVMYISRDRENFYRFSA